MRFHFAAQDDAPGWYPTFHDALARTLGARGHEECDLADPALKLVFHLVDVRDPHPFVRKHRAIFAVGIAALDAPADRLLETAYPLLVRSLSNALIVVLAGDPSNLWVLTPELGCYPIVADGDVYGVLYDRIAPMAEAHLVIDNAFVPDLPEELWGGTEETRELTWVSRVVDGWGLLPAPFPIRDILSPDQWRYLQHLYGIGGLSYGNFSIRHDARSFWMSASGVNKGDLKEVGRDILLVAGFDEERSTMILRVPPDVRPRRVSVDAVEHWMIYNRFPEIGAMIHLHAWVPSIPVTRFNYPCGTTEVGDEVAAILEREADPARAIVGMKNHGITVTGPNFHDIVERLENHVRPQVPMGAEEAL